MQQVNVFIETSSRFRGNVERKCGYVLSTQLRTGKETREHFGRVTGTYHQAILLTMVDALDHMTRTCDVCFYISDLYVTSRLGKITEMAGSGWLDTKGKLCWFREEMQGDLMDRICGRCGLQQYTDRIREEYEKINNFDKSQTSQLMNRYRKITLCKDCRYRGGINKPHCVGKMSGIAGTLMEGDGCSRGEER